MRKFKNVIKSLLIAIGVLSSFVTILWALFSTSLNTLVSMDPWWFLLVLFIIAFSYALFTNRTKNRIHLKLSEKVKATVFFG